MLWSIPELISNGQFESALDALAALGEKVNPGAKFWSSLSQAAAELLLTEKAKHFQLLWAEAASLALEREISRK